MAMASPAASLASSSSSFSGSQSVFLFRPSRSSRRPSPLPRPRCHLLPTCFIAPHKLLPSRFPIRAPFAARSRGCDPLLRAVSDPGATAEDVGGGGAGMGGEGYGSGGGRGGGGGRKEEGGGGASEGGEGKEKAGGMSMSQKITLAYAALVGVGGLMGYLRGGSQKSLAAGGLSALLLYLVYTQLPVRPALASSLGLGLSAALLAVMGSRFRKSGKIFPAGVVSLMSFVMVGGYLHGILRSLH